MSAIVVPAPNYCAHYTHQKSGVLGNYDFTINGSRFCIEGSTDLIVAAVQARVTPRPAAQDSR